MFCTNCGSKVPNEVQFCSNCGTKKGLTQQPVVAPYVAAPYQKSRVTAGVLAILLGGIGIHKFYLRKIWPGVIYILLCWTYIPAVVSLVEGIIYLVQDDKTFAEKQASTRF